MLSQTAFCGAVHMHGKANNRLLADLDCNGWPQTPRNRALEEIRRAWAVHLCGDQHLAVVTKQGIEEFGDGPYSFTSPALVNTIYGRWWHPLDEKAGPESGAGQSAAVDRRFQGRPRQQDLDDGLRESAGHQGRTPARGRLRHRAFRQEERAGSRSNAGRAFPMRRRRAERSSPAGRSPSPWKTTTAAKSAGYLPELIFEGGANPVVQVIEEATGEILYTVRVRGERFQPRVYATGKHTIKLGADKPNTQTLAALEPKPKPESGQRVVTL